VVGPMPKAARRHHRPLVPMEQKRERVERLVVAEAGLQLLEGVGQDARSLAMRRWRTGLEPATTTALWVRRNASGCVELASLRGLSAPTTHARGSRLVAECCHDVATNRLAHTIDAGSILTL
jgi:hypothetical protein